MPVMLFLLHTVVALLFLTACQTAPNETVISDELNSFETYSISDTDHLVLTFRSDGVRPGLTSEWIELVVDVEENKIINMHYWSTANDSKSAVLVIEQDYFMDEISGFVGKIRFSSEDVYEFGLIEDRFNLLDDYGLFQEFFLELNE